MKLEFGQTPWDNWSKEDLLRLVQKQHIALVSAKTCLRQCKTASSNGSYWYNKGGTGYQTEAMVQACLPYTMEEENEIYHAFARYAIDLLFTPELGFNWHVCSNGHMWGYEPIEGDNCDICKEPLRRLEWSDITPKEKTAK